MSGDFPQDDQFDEKRYGNTADILSTADSVHQQRYVSLLTRKTMALVLAGGRGSRLHELTEWRAKPAVHFGGKFHIVDFALSNAINSGIRRIGVLTQYKAHSLVRHLRDGWCGFKRALGEFVDVLPASQRIDAGWYRGTADAVYQNLDIIRDHKPEYVLILSGDHIYKMDYGTMLAFHADTQADLTISCIEIPVAEAAGVYGVLQVDESGRVIAFEEKPAKPSEIPGQPGMCLASMGNYVFGTRLLYNELIHDADDEASDHDFAKNIIPAVIHKHEVFAFPFRDPKTGKCAYWRDVGTLDAYWQANIELLNTTPELNLYDSEWPILTDQPQLAPAKFVFNNEDRRGMAVDSMVSGGCVISGATVDRSLLYSNVKVHSYAHVEQSVVLPDVSVGRHTRILRSIIDRGCVIPDRMVIGVNHEEDRERGFRVTANGIVLVTPDMLGQPVHTVR
ncbi:MAG: glucose-1-phosphate adenylyltransferase [Gammaproteobacteria bacterium]|jgi:glucose-1-phosphate adenylyltransferase|nr:glucose-1-phosphate adenylyltransferase [Gammaproteobacteria bacterium]